MLASDIPPDVWTAISSYVVHPKNHITLSQICQSSRSIYTGEDAWKLLCRSIGIGRGTQEKGESWKKVFMEVVGHRDRCRLPQCYEYGVPPMRMLGDLLPSSQAALEHYEYFKRKEAEKAKDCGCPCGHENMCGDPIMHMLTHGLGEFMRHPEDDEEDDSDADEERDATSDDPNTNAPNGVPPLPASLNPFAQLFAGLGLAIAPAVMSVDPTTGLPTFSAPQPADTTPPSSGGRKRKNKPSQPYIKPQLLPLSHRNENHVPSRPHLHAYLADLGNVYFKHFLNGGIALNNGYVRLQYNRETPSSSRGIDWEGREVDKEDMPCVHIDEHPLLARAFATNPPVTELRVMVQILEMKVINKAGVTVKDVVHHLNKFLSKRMTLKDHLAGCDCHPPLTSCMDSDSRFAYLMELLGASEDPDARTRYEDCYLRGIVNFCGNTGATMMMLVPN